MSKISWVVTDNCFENPPMSTKIMFSGNCTPFFTQERPGTKSKIVRQEFFPKSKVLMVQMNEDRTEVWEKLNGERRPR